MPQRYIIQRPFAAFLKFLPLSTSFFSRIPAIVVFRSLISMSSADGDTGDYPTNYPVLQDKQGRDIIESTIDELAKYLEEEGLGGLSENVGGLEEFLLKRDGGTFLATLSLLE
jgi:hypothetical protein